MILMIQPIRESEGHSVSPARVLGLAILAASTLVTVACIVFLIRTLVRLV
jgi:hypothetical protein